jgi:ABC-type branched-subunit amino acid transport system substrate-binding protein
MNKRWKALVGAGTAVALMSTGLAFAGVASAATATNTGVTKKSITIGGLVQETNASGSSESSAITGAKAYFTQLNKQGGINGRKVNFVGALTDFGTPTKDATQAKALVQEKHVFAVVPVASSGFSSGATFLVKSGVPFFGWGTAPGFCNNTVGFGYDGCLVPSASQDQVGTTPAGLVADLLKKQGKTPKNTTVALIAQDNTSGSFGVTVSKAAFVADGFKVVYSKAAVPATGTTNYTPYVSTIMKSATGNPPDVMYYVTQVPITIGMTAAMKAAGFKGIQLDPTSYTLPARTRPPRAVTSGPSTRRARQGPRPPRPSTRRSPPWPRRTCPRQSSPTTPTSGTCRRPCSPPSPRRPGRTSPGPTS